MPRSSTLTTSASPTPDAKPPNPRSDRSPVRSVVPPVLTEHMGTRRQGSHLLWHERVVTATGRYIQLTIPLVGRYQADLGTHLAAYLDRLWTDQPTPGGERITSVSALVGHKSGRSFLILFLSLDEVPLGRRIDDARMARHLKSALHEVTSRDAQAA